MKGMRIGVIGGGAWGTALAQVAAHGGRPVLLWAREPEVVESVTADRRNHLFLPGIDLAPTIRATGDLAARMLLPSLYGLDSDGLLPGELRIVATART